MAMEPVRKVNWHMTICAFNLKSALIQCRHSTQSMTPSGFLIIAAVIIMADKIGYLLVT